MKLELRDSVYEPREDSYLLQKEVERRSKGRRVLDMGCGSGIQAITAALSGAKEVWACDLNPSAISTTQENARLNGTEVNAFLSDLFSAIHPDEMFDLIAFNAPYLEPSTPLDVQWSGGGKLINTFLEQAKNHLTKNGQILFVFSSLTNLDSKPEVVSEQKMPDGEKIFIGLITHQ